MTAEREKRVRQRLKALLSDLFYVEEEIVGEWPIDNRKLRLDLLLKPKQKAKDLGFDVEAVGIEIKDPESKESIKKLLDCVMQAYTYTFCEFNGSRPDFILIYPPVERFFDYDWEHKYKFDEKCKPVIQEIRILRRIMQRANVGELEILDDDNYKFNFAANPFFHSVKGRSPVKGLGLNRYVGSKKSR